MDLETWKPFLPKATILMRPRGDSWAALQLDLKDCQRCGLCAGRTHIVFGEGHPEADLVFVGEGPGEQEDLQARPFVGRSGQLLTKMIEAMGLRRDQVFIVNVVKCRPPHNRDPKPEEIQACRPFLERQLALLRPRVIVTLGKFAAQTLLKTETRISDLRGRFHALGEAEVMPTFHPAYLLRNPSAKKEAWEDLRKVMRKLEIPEPKG
jgi:uracil-DNA glycosylase